MDRNKDIERINLAEETLSKILFDICAIYYRIDIESEFFDEEACEEMLEDSEFSCQNDPVESICIYKMDTPAVYVNVDDYTDVDSAHEIQIDWDIEYVFPDELDKKLKKLGLKSFEAITALRIIDDIRILPSFSYGTDNPSYESVGNKEKCLVFLKECGMEKKESYIDNPFELIEMIFYYRQAHLLEQRIRESGNFNLSSSFHVESILHDSFEKIQKQVWEFTKKNISTPLFDVLDSIGIPKEA